MTLHPLKKPFAALTAAIALSSAQSSFACGGFFCDILPIDQAGEQIVFRQEGTQTTAMIKIDYVGSAEDFGWVLPVPTSPTISLGSDQTFTELDLATRPTFLLDRQGQGCIFASASSSSSSGSSSSSSASSSAGSVSTGVIVEQFVSVGPFDAQVISSDDPAALAKWLADNNLDLTEQGDELLAPYINAKSKFVVLKLKNNASVSSIQPIILEYEASAPVIPMTLTAVAAQDNMGVLVWLLGDGRGVPKNFHHVTPNYTRLNWFRGNRNAYASYQGLITQAMDEAGGQGFATDFAGHLPNLMERFTTAERWENLLTSRAELSDASFIADMWQFGNSATIQNAIRSALPTSDAFVYSQPLVMQEQFSEQALSEARTAVSQAIQDQLITPTNNALDILDDNLYLTRLYTTLSADEMTENPEFTYNTQMPGQQLSRNATLTQACVEGQNHWTLTLGEGTGREGEVVAEAWGFGSPFNPVVDSGQQEAMWRAQRTSATSDPVIIAENEFETALLGVQIGASGGLTSSSGSPTSSSSSSSSGTTSSSSSSATSSTSSSSSTSASSSGNASNPGGSSGEDGSGRAGGSAGLLSFALLGLAALLGGRSRIRKKPL